ncbi:MAG: hypothetical protein M0Z49_05650, partial [Chloroflexi bacterium]|nr:hypothetical protein [Chloroflexota bacterium]
MPRSPYHLPGQHIASASPQPSLAAREQESRVHLFLVGAGPVGLVTAVGFARLGHHVTVSDIDARRIATLAAGRSPIFEPGLEEALRAETAAGRMDFTVDPTPPVGSAFSIVCVGTPTDESGPLST